MKLPSDIVGERAGPSEQEIDARWLMAYAAGLGETDPRYYDTAGHEASAIRFETRGAQGEPVVSRGTILLNG